MDEQELDNIYSLLQQVINSSTKKEAAPFLKALEIQKDKVKSIYGGNASYKLGEAMDSAESSAGRIPKEDKEHHEIRAKMHWSTFKSILANQARRT